jgi:DNA-directed RNA polymerase subunit alpha
MKNIPLPNKINYTKTDENNEGMLTIEPCYPGYGVMIGSALRRVLLSSLLGGAVTAVKIKGVSHEFSTVPNVAEDVVEIILNLKKLKLKVDSEEVLVLKLKAKGKKEVTGADIAKHNDVEVSNPELVIATLTDKNAEIEMDIYVTQGRGYVTTEEKDNKGLGVGVISIDSIFTPVRNVSVEVQNVRVGEMTNYDKLTMKIVTDGSISPEEAVKKSSVILIEHFSLLTGESDK